VDGSLEDYQAYLYLKRGTLATWQRVSNGIRMEVSELRAGRDRSKRVAVSLHGKGVYASSRMETIWQSSHSICR